MNNLAVIERDGILVVDCRLVAEQIGIQHRSFFQKVILKYQIGHACLDCLIVFAEALGKAN